MGLTIVVGAQWGDEGKGKIVDLLAADAHMVARYAGGPNAGHTVVLDDGTTVVLHMIPAGALRPGVVCVIGPGTVVDTSALLSELTAVEGVGVELRSRLVVSASAHLILPYHRVIERERDLTRLGTTGRGIGQAYRDKAGRIGIRVGDLLDRVALETMVRGNLARLRQSLRPEARHLAEVDPAHILAQLRDARETLGPLVGDGPARVRAALERGEPVLAEGAQGTLLDIDHGTYPYVTSSSAIAGGALTGLGVGPRWVERVIGVMKAYTTRVGEGPFPTELPPDEGATLRDLGNEYGATTGRPRRCGWLDLVALRYAARVNGLTDLVVTKLDVLDDLPRLRVCVAYRCAGRRVEEFPADARALGSCEPVYEDLPGWQTSTAGVRSQDDLPAAARSYLARITEAAGVPITMVSVGATRDATIYAAASPAPR